MSVPLFALTAATLGWASLTSYVAYQVMTHKYATKDAYNFAIAGMVVSITVFIVFGLYAYTRSSTEEEPDMEAGLIKGFRWYDAVVLFFMLGLCGISIGLSSMLIDYEEQARQEDKKDTSATRDVAIANIVISIIILILYMVYLFVQDRIPEWCQEYASQEKAKREELRALYDEPRERRSSSKEGGVTVVLQQGGQAEPRKRDSLSLEEDD